MGEIMSWLLGLGTPLGRLGVIGSIILALVGMRACDINKQRRIGETRAVANMEKASDANAAKAEKARNEVAKTPVDRLNDKYRRD